MKTEPSHGWYSFHFGSKMAASAAFRPEELAGGADYDCCVLLADFCSFTAFMRATENAKEIEPLLTTFYTEARKAIHQHSGMLYQIVGDSVCGVWGLPPCRTVAVKDIVAAARELAEIADRLATEWQARIDLLVEPKGLRVGLSKGPLVIVRRDGVYPGLLLFGNPLNLAARLQAAAGPNQLVCSNSAYRQLAQSKPSLSFRAYEGERTTDGALAGKNYGTVKAWVLDLQPTRRVSKP